MFTSVHFNFLAVNNEDILIIDISEVGERVVKLMKWLEML
jgi:hypothetical protein